jgi:hypothetical protein
MSCKCVNLKKQVLKNIIQAVDTENCYCSYVSSAFFYKYLIISVLLVCKFSVFAGNRNDPAGGRSAGLSHASVCFYDGWGCFNNQAGLGYLQNPAIGLYFENRFSVKEFSTKAGFIAYPVKPAALALNFRHFGYSKYSESKVGLAVGRKLAKRLSVGVQVNYLQTHFGEDYGNYHSVTGEIGILSEPVNNLHVGFHLFNFPKANTGSLPDEQIPVIARFGISWSFKDKALLAFETLKEMETQPLFKVGLEVETLQNLYARVGFTTQINNYSVGLGYMFKRVLIDMAFTNNRILGFSPQVSIEYGL